MAAFDKLNRGFLFANAGVAQQQHTFAIDFDQHAVKLYHRCKRNLELGNNRTHNGIGKFICTENGGVMLFCCRKAFWINVNIP